MVKQFWTSASLRDATRTLSRTILDFGFWIDLTDKSTCSVHQGIIGHEGSRKALNLEVEPLSLEVTLLKNLITKIYFSCSEKLLIPASSASPTAFRMADKINAVVCSQPNLLI
ncbi:MAG: hypothetical protein V7K88_07775 [Nostoc sp.]